MYDENTSPDKTQELMVAIASVREDVERLERILANLLLMQKVIGATVEGLLDILRAKGLVYDSELEAINADITEAIGKEGAGQ